VQGKIDVAKAVSVLSAMRGHAAGWADTRVGHQDEDGEGPAEYWAQVKYDQAEEDAALDVLHELDGWIEALNEALGLAPAQG
jgi:hypothetical protein